MKKKILHIDDARYWLHILAEALKARGYEVVSLNSIPSEPELDSLLKQHRFDLIILDGTIQAKDDGAELGRKLKAAGHRVAMMPTYYYPDMDNLRASTDGMVLTQIDRWISDDWKKQRP
jgi:response regulator RpfG family c-di-GMP phosphodiesterase